MYVVQYLQREETGTETVFLTFKGAQESIPPAYVAWKADTTTLFLLGSQQEQM